VSRATRLIVGCEVVEHRDHAAMQQFVAGLPQAERYYTDGFSTYPGLDWPEGGQHLVSIGKANTFTVEGMNAQFRQYLGPLRRRTRGFAKKIENLRELVSWFVYHWNARQRLYLSNRKLKGKLSLRTC